MTGTNRPGSARSSACATAVAALLWPPPVSPMRKSNGTGCCSGVAIAHLHVFCCPGPRERAVNGFPAAEQAIAVVIADDARGRPRHPRPQPGVAAEQAEAVGVRHEAEEAHPVRHAVMAGERAQPGVVRPGPGEDEHRAVRAGVVLTVTG